MSHLLTQGHPSWLAGHPWLHSSSSAPATIPQLNRKCSISTPGGKDKICANQLLSSWIPNSCCHRLDDAGMGDWTMQVWETGNKAGHRINRRDTLVIPRLAVIPRGIPARLKSRAVGRSGEKEQRLDDLQVAAEGLEEGKPVRLRDAGLAPVVHALGAPQHAHRGLVDACLHVLQGRTEAYAGDAELNVELEEGDTLFAGVATVSLPEAKLFARKERQKDGWPPSKVEAS